MFTNENYTGGNQKKQITWKDIQNMKKLMKWVPIIQKKSDEYHKNEKEKADKEFENKINNL